MRSFFLPVFIFPLLPVIQCDEAYLLDIHCFPVSSKKKMRRSFCSISVATNMLEGWDIFHLNGGIHRSMWSTKTFLYDIWGPRYKEIYKTDIWLC